jgi:hypothetical protein
MENVPKKQQLLFDYTLSVTGWRKGGGGDLSHKPCTSVTSINNKSTKATIHKLSTIH